MLERPCRDEFFFSQPFLGQSGGIHPQETQPLHNEGDHYAAAAQVDDFIRAVPALDAHPQIVRNEGAWDHHGLRVKVPASISGSSCKIASRTTAARLEESFLAAESNRSRECLSKRIGTGLVGNFFSALICRRMYTSGIRCKEKSCAEFCIVYQINVAETKPIPVRLGDEIIARLDKAAKRLGTKRAGIIRFLVDSWLDDFEKRGRASLPVNWPEILEALDNRTAASKRIPVSAEYPAKIGHGSFKLNTEVNSAKASDVEFWAGKASPEKHKSG